MTKLIIYISLSTWDLPLSPFISALKYGINLKVVNRRSSSSLRINGIWHYYTFIWGGAPTEESEGGMIDKFYDLLELFY